MKYFVFLLVLTMAIFNFTNDVFADKVWQSVAGIIEVDIKEITVDDYKEGIIYVATIKTMYRSKDGGDTWRVVFSVRGYSNVINFISASRHGIFVCTEKGLFRSSDGKTDRKRSFEGVGTEENSASHIAFSDEDNAYLGTKAGLFVSGDNGLTWKKDSREAGDMSVKWISFLENDIFLATEKGVYKSSDSGWKRVFVTSTEESEYDSDSTDEAVSAVKPVNSILVNKGKLFLATDSGIFASEDKGDSWRRFTSNGLLSRRVKRLLIKDALYAATDKGIFVFNDKDKIWKALYKGMSTNEVRSISTDNERTIWAATNKGLYKSRIDNPSFLVNEEQDILERFGHEPSIGEVQETAVRYAEVHPDKIEEWRESAKRKALLPNISVGLDRYVTDYYHWDAGQNPDVFQKGDDVIVWDVTMSWNLGELIWNDDQTSIDTRSRLMVQLRDDILDEITRTYFERRRLQVETYLSPSSNLKQRLEKELRIQELTADLDALTGGRFSEQLNQ